MLAIIGGVFLILAVLSIIGFASKSNRNNQEYVDSAKFLIGRAILYNIGIPCLVVLGLVLGAFLYLFSHPSSKESDSSTNYTSNVDTSSNRQSSNQMMIGDGNNRLITGNEANEIHDEVVSGMTPEQVMDSMSIREPGEDNSRVYIDRNSGFSIRFPRGWQVDASSGGAGVVIADNYENGSTIKVSRETEEDHSPLSLSKAKMVGEYFLSQVLQHEPSARLQSSNMIKDFNGHEAVGIFIRLTGPKIICFFVIPYQEYAYLIGFEGPEYVFREEAAASMLSFRIL